MIYDVVKTSENSTVLSSGSGNIVSVPVAPVVSSTQLQIEVSDYVEIARREYVDDLEGLFDSLVIRQLGMNRDSSSGYVTIVYKDSQGVRHDFLENASISAFWENGSTGLIKPLDDKGIELVGDIVSTGNIEADVITGVDGFLDSLQVGEIGDTTVNSYLYGKTNCDVVYLNNAQDTAINAATRKDYVDGKFTDLTGEYVSKTNLGIETMAGSLVVDGTLDAGNADFEDVSCVDLELVGFLTCENIFGLDGYIGLNDPVGISGTLNVSSSITFGNNLYTSGNMELHTNGETTQRFTFLNDGSTGSLYYRDEATSLNKDLILGNSSFTQGTIKCSTIDNKVYVSGDLNVGSDVTFSSTNSEIKTTWTNLGNFTPINTQIENFISKEIIRYHDKSIHLKFEFKSLTSVSYQTELEIAYYSGNPLGLNTSTVSQNYVFFSGNPHGGSYESITLGLRYDSVNSRTELLLAGGNMKSNTVYKINQLCVV